MQQDPNPTPGNEQQERLEAIQELHKVAKGSQEVLMTATSVFPLTLFPSTVAVDRTQVSITKRVFIMAGNVTSMRLEDILNVTAQVGPFFGTVHIETRFFDTDKSHEVRLLWRHEALRLAALLNGLIVATKNNIDITKLGRRELVDELVRIGQNPTDSQP